MSLSTERLKYLQQQHAIGKLTEGEREELEDAGFFDELHPNTCQHDGLDLPDGYGP